MKRHINTWNKGLALALAFPLLSGYGASFATAADAPGYAPSSSAATMSPPGPQSAPTVPSNIDPQSPLAEVIKLAQAGVGETVIQSYIANSQTPFNLDSDEIIYLRDLGLSDASINAMLQRDQALGATASAPAPQPQPQPQPVSAPLNPPAQALPADETYFYDSLQPYGSWVDVEGVGPCWQPTVVYVNPTWQPYCDGGHWVYTDCGWYWTSDYSWGWAPFHYGRWFRDNRRGWCWAPDRQWGPAWVTWRYSDNYCGWAPLPPGAGFRAGVGFTFHGRGVDANFGFGLGSDFFTFVAVGNFTDRHPWEHRVERGDRDRVYKSTTVINNIVVGNNNTIINNGIGRERIENATHTPLKPVHVAANDDRNPAGGRHEHFEGGNLVVDRPPLNEHAENGGHNIPHFDAPPRNLPGNRGNGSPGNNSTAGHNGNPTGNNPSLGNPGNHFTGNNNGNGNGGNQSHNIAPPFTPVNTGPTHDISTPVTSGNPNDANNRHRTVFDHDSGPKVTTPSTPMTTPSTHMTTPSTTMTTPGTHTTTPNGPVVHNQNQNPFINTGNNPVNYSGPVVNNNNTRYNSPRIESQFVPARQNVVQPTFPRNNPTVTAPATHVESAPRGGNEGGNGGGGGGGGGGNRGGGGGNGNGGGDKRDH